MQQNRYKNDSYLYMHSMRYSTICQYFHLLADC